ncbi:MAG: hypothetical protein IRZ33_07890, partial [Alicyclobacillaceae bacterium]|nr:hypothetical protein [Alicyclobacillaceae bacterium]
MRRRILIGAHLFFLCTAVLAARQLALASLPGSLRLSETAQPDTPGRPPLTRADADREHLAVQRVEEARGRILFRSGEPWWPAPGRGRHTTVGVTASVQAAPQTTGGWTHSGGRATGGMAHASDAAGVANTAAAPVVGLLGRPDVWPSRVRVAEEEGRSGLEATFDPLLRGARTGAEGVLRDALGRMYPADRFRLPAVRGYDVRTTVDAAWQGVAERVLARAGVDLGAVVVLDADTGDVLAMAGIDRRHPWSIPAVRAEIPGSVFKLVTAAAALESYLYAAGSVFDCTGWATVPGVRMRCWTRHGRETLLDAIAASCDAAFADIGVRVGERGLAEMARRLHLDTDGLQAIGGRPVLAESEAGVVFRQLHRASPAPAAALARRPTVREGAG